MMKKFYRFAALILIGVLALSVLTGCSENDLDKNLVAEQLIKDVFAEVNRERSPQDQLDNNLEKYNYELQKLLGLVSDDPEGYGLMAEDVANREILEGAQAKVLASPKQYEQNHKMKIALRVSSENSAQAVARLVNDIETHSPTELCISYRSCGDYFYIAYAYKIQLT